MASSLEKLASYLEKLSIAEEEFQLDYITDQTELLKRKGVFPYDYISCFDKLKETELPTKEELYNKLNDSHISDDDYEHAKAVWQAFDIQTLGEYSDLYLKTDVLLLADVFENFRDNCLEAYGLDPAHYYTTPGLTWAMLKWCESNRYTKTNNRHMGETYNKTEESKYLVYYDVNNLYGWTMRECMPYGGFKWVNVAVETSDFFQVPDDHPVGYILEVDLEYPEALHDAHKDLPLCPERMPAPGTRQEKLMTTLYDKERYVIHYRSLKQALKHGLRLKKIHRVLKFDQRAWLRSYIDLNSEKRKKAKNDFEKLLYKLFNNAIYGKTMENERKRIDVKLVTKWGGRYGTEALVAKPNFHSCSIFEENLVAVELARTEITVRKPLYIGLCVLDLSKSLVYDFHYEYMRDRVGDRCKLLYTDTDSLVYELTDINMYEVMRQDIDHFDTSDYPETNQFGIPRANKKVVGLMKDECCGRVMTEFVGLRSKMYSVKIEGQDVIKKAKGVKAAVVRTTITFDDYVECLRQNTRQTRQQCNIRSRLHVVRSEKESKIALSPHDNKRYLVPGETDTLPWGHYAISEKMDITKLNQIAHGGFLPTKKFSECAKNQQLLVTALRKVSTKYDKRVVAELNNEFQMFLPSRVSDALNRNEDFFESLQESIQHYKLFVKYTDHNNIEFSD
ncbi:uncharacterized protein LOC116418324 [Nasonia vitripennis]|uniref:DNA-directed DNA polymerase n=1 Tax=Nasonia vitripennis TaxID=7425 RepID=A0A7M7QN59_NASVI|nr:uncharacterized protein LOC116418324 [Nasonia vitripennis]